MKKILVLTCIIFIVVTANVSALGIGGVFGIDAIGTGNPANAMVSLKLDQYPVVFGVGGIIGNNFALGVTADLWLYHAPLFGIVSLYAGPGIYMHIADNFGLGLRIPVGFQIFVIEPLEIFLELAPTIGVGFGDESVTFPVWGLQAGLGFRFWF